MRSAILAFFLVVWSASFVQAGAWLRAEGSGFVSTAVSSNQMHEISTSAYAEYGLSPTRTIGFDISYGFELTGKQEGSGILFMRFPLGPTDQTNRFAWHVGLGARYLNLEFYPAVEAGISWGRGIKIGERWGWAAVDASVNQSQSPIERRIKIDGTVGIPLSDHFKVMVQVFNTFQGGETFSKLAPSLLFTAKDSKTTWQLSAEIPAQGGGETAFKLGIWREF